MFLTISEYRKPIFVVLDEDNNVEDIYVQSGDTEAPKVLLTHNVRIMVGKVFDASEFDKQVMEDSRDIELVYNNKCYVKDPS